MKDYSIQPAVHDQWPEVLALLVENNLPEAGLIHHREGILVATERGDVIGCVALEIHGEFGLLRSLAVGSPQRGRGLGGELTDAVMSAAEEKGLRAVFLLTETAESFFSARGFVPVDRGAVPSPIRATVEFSGACPSSAIVMKRGSSQGEKGRLD